MASQSGSKLLYCEVLGFVEVGEPRQLEGLGYPGCRFDEER